MLKGVFLRTLRLYMDAMGSFLDVEWVFSSVTPPIGGVSLSLHYSDFGLNTGVYAPYFARNV